jgi:2-polyprenyl-3-methyl-5-hydroxy-6-metoxy-1,4-benzoquinol methylase
VSFKHRSYQKELLDRENIPFEDIKRNMLELDFINTHLGGHKITLKGIKAFAKTSPLSITEIGCGDGNNLRVIKEWCRKKNIEAKITGIDINKECIEFARQRPLNKDIKFTWSDYRLVKFDVLPDILFSSLFCHHFSDEELIAMMQWMHRNSRIGFFINDLHRHPLAYYSIKLLTRFFSKSYLVKHDAPLSVKRGMLKSEWQEIFARAGIANYTIQWQWAFRWLIIYFK